MKRGLRDPDYLRHIEEAISKILRYTADRGETEFLSDEVVQDAVLRNLEIIGEAANKLSAELKSRHPEIDWRKIAGMRNRVVHEYFQVNLTVVFDTVKVALPKLLHQVSSLRKKLDG